MRDTRTDAPAPPVCVAAFNLDPALYVHASWLPRRPVALRGEVSALPGEARRALSSWLTTTHDLHHALDWELDEPAKKVFLAAPEWLERLQLEVGIALQQSGLAQAIDGTVQRQLRSLPGVSTQALQFALVQAPAAPAPAGVAGLDALLRSPARAAHRLRRDGAWALLGLLDPRWTAIAKRAQLRVPRGLRSLQCWHGDTALRERWSDYVFGQLIPGRHQPWRWLC